jgi:DNA-binding transcriptional ArsR family regulator
LLIRVYYSNFSSRKHFYYISRKENSGADLAETDEYDAIFAALKHPVRRQILLFIEQKGEASFTDIQNAAGISDTGLMSYHLRELAPLIEQSARGKYRLSEIGQTSMSLFRKVEQEKQRTSNSVRREIEKMIGEVVFIFFIIGVTLMVPLSSDIYLSVQTIYQGISAEQTIGLFLISLLGMVLGVILFTFYDRHYFSKSVRTNIIHAAIFAVGICLLSMPSTYTIYTFEAPLSNGSAALLFIILRPITFLASAPLITYGISRLSKR